MTSNIINKEIKASAHITINKLAHLRTTSH